MAQDCAACAPGIKCCGALRLPGDVGGAAASPPLDAILL